MVSKLAIISNVGFIPEQSPTCIRMQDLLFLQVNSPVGHSDLGQLSSSDPSLQSRSPSQRHEPSTQYGGLPHWNSSDEQVWKSRVANGQEVSIAVGWAAVVAQWQSSHQRNKLLRLQVPISARCWAFSSLTIPQQCFLNKVPQAGAALLIFPNKKMMLR